MEWVRETEGTSERKDGGMMRRDGTEIILSLLLNTCESLILLLLLFLPDSHVMSSCSSRTPCGSLKSSQKSSSKLFVYCVSKASADNRPS